MSDFLAKINIFIINFIRYSKNTLHLDSVYKKTKSIESIGLKPPYFTKKQPLLFNLNSRFYRYLNRWCVILNGFQLRPTSSAKKLESQ